MTHYTHEATVSGSGEFPFDMLRYDACFPATEAETGRMMERGVRDVRVRAMSTNKHAPWTTPRWESFGWRVTTVHPATKF